MCAAGGVAGSSVLPRRRSLPRRPALRPRSRGRGTVRSDIGGVDDYTTMMRRAHAHSLCRGQLDLIPTGLVFRRSTGRA